MYAEHVDRDTFMAYGPFHPVRLAQERRMQDVDSEWECLMEEATEEAREQGAKEEKTGRRLRLELTQRVESLEQQLAAAPKPADMWAMRYALDWIAKGNMTKADMIATAKKSLAEIAQRKLEAAKAA